MKVLAQDGSGAGDTIANGYVNGETAGVVMSVMSRRPENLISKISQLKEDHPDMLLLVDNHVHSSVFPDTDKHGQIPKYGLFDMNITAFNLQDDDTITNMVDGMLDFQNGLNLDILTSPSLAMQEFNDANARVCLEMYKESMRYVADNDTGEKKLFLTLVFSEQALSQVHSMAQMLDKLCLLDVDGFYIIVQRQKNDTPMWSSSDTLANLMYLVNSLHESDYEIIIGYTDLWGVLLSAVGADYITAGWYQTLRQYCQNFYRHSDGGPGTPLYVSEKLMSTIYTNPDLRNIINSSPDLGSRVVDSHYGASLLRDPDQATWTKEAYALQHWRAVKNIISQFSDTDSRANLAALETQINGAQALAADIRAANISLDERHDDRHLGIWKSAIEKYRSGVL